MEILKLTEKPILEATTEDTYILAHDAEGVKRVPASAVGGGFKDVVVNTIYDSATSNFVCEIIYNDTTITAINCSDDQCRITDDEASALADYIKTNIPRIILNHDDGRYFCLCDWSVASDNIVQLSSPTIAFWIYPESAEA